MGIVASSPDPALCRTIVEGSVYVWAVVASDTTITYLSPSAEQPSLAGDLADSVPVVMGVRHADGSTVHVEAAAEVHLDDPEIRGIVVRLRPYDDQFLLERDLEALATSVPVEQTLQPLVASIKA